MNYEFNMASVLRPQDVVVSLKLAVATSRGWRQQALAQELGLSPAEIHNSLKRLERARLYDPSSRQVMRQALLEFLVHGLKYVYPAQLGGPVRGMPTGWAAAPLIGKLVANESERPVWPHAEGTVRGAALEPLYPSAPSAAAADPRLYELLALVDAIRVGGARERKLASDTLQQRLAA